MKRSRIARAARLPLLALLVTVYALTGCSTDELTGTKLTNTRPKVWLSIAPPEAATVDYRVHIYWYGFDPDGKISHYEFTVADNDTGTFDPGDTLVTWHSTTALDSVFVFTADLIADSSSVDFESMNPYEFKRTHTFFLRAVDNEGAASEPVYRSFTARNLSPVVNIEIPKAGGGVITIVPPVITFRWSARDFVGNRDEAQDPDAVRSIMVNTARFGGRTDLAMDYIRDNPDAEEWTKWYHYNAPGDSGRFWRSSQPLAFGSYMFAVQVKDEVGAISPVFDPSRNMRLVRVDSRITGPSLFVSSRFLGQVSTSTTNTPVTSMWVPSGVPVSFRWSADASSYGGVVHSYRYGWDIEDLNSDSDWDVTDTPFIGGYATSPPRTFYFGTHTFHVEVKDNAGAKSRVPIAVNVVPFTMERPVLVVDDWGEGLHKSFFATGGAEPGDAEQDAFFADLLRDVDGFSASGDMIPYGTSELTELPINLLAHYRAVIWNTRGRVHAVSPETLFEKLVQDGSPELNLLSRYMAAGGKVLICGDHAMTMIINKKHFYYGPSYPLIFRYELRGDQTYPYQGQEVGVRGFGDESFAYNECCLNVVDEAYTYRINLRRTCPVTNVRDFSGQYDGLRGCLPLDGTYAFPKLELRPEAADVGKWFAPERIGYPTDIFNPSYFMDCEYAELNPPRDCFQPMYGLDCLNHDSAVYRAPVAFWTSRFANIADPNGVAARSAVFGFPLVFIKPEQAKAAMDIILFDEWKLPRVPPSSVESRPGDDG